uniref:Ion_trans_2 domain-containing protein n=1 Tax=Steinernema glaseri TaxID=37863 RepID=A0A1I7YTH1_9BILA
MRSFTNLGPEDSAQNNQEISYAIATSVHEDEVGGVPRDTVAEQRHPICPLFYFVIVPLYTLFGAVLFYLCENTYTTDLTSKFRNRCSWERDQALKDLEVKFALSTSNLSMDSNGTFQEPFSFDDVRNATMFLDGCFRSWKHPNGMEPKAVTFLTACVFTVNTLTTVGYGAIVPYTVPGRILTMLMASIGIPLYIAFNADIGEWISKQMVRLCLWMRRAYVKLVQRRALTIEERLKPVDELAKFFFLVIVILIFLFSHAYTTMALENATLVNTRNWSYFDAMYFLFITITLVGFGDIVINNGYIFLFVQLPILLFGEAAVALYYYFIQNAIRYKIPAMVERRFAKRFGKKSKKEARRRMSTETAEELVEAEVDRERKRRSRRRFRKLRNAFLGRKDDTEREAPLLPSEPLDEQGSQKPSACLVSTL